MKKIILPGSYNYVGCFLTLKCNMDCSYCINNYSDNFSDKNSRQMSGNEWINAINRLVVKNDLPVTLQGGEPGLHEDFVEIINGIKDDINIDILTNLSFDINEFIKNINPKRLNRKAPYAPIRVTFHPDTSNLSDLIKKATAMMNAGFRIGIYGILHPMYLNKIDEAKKVFKDHGIDFRVKEFLGKYDGKLYGKYKYPEAVDSAPRICECKGTELLIAPSGDTFRCHHDLYSYTDPLKHILSSDFKLPTGFKKCSNYGRCNYCDIKIKTNRFQKFGHTSVTIKNIQ